MKSDYQIVNLTGINFKYLNRKVSYSDETIKNVKTGLYGSFDGTLPYRPLGGKKALEAILENDNIQEIFPYWISDCKE